MFYQQNQFPLTSNINNATVIGLVMVFYFNFGITIIKTRFVLFFFYFTNLLENLLAKGK